MKEEKGDGKLKEEGMIEGCVGTKDGGECSPILDRGCTRDVSVVLYCPVCCFQYKFSH